MISTHLSNTARNLCMFLWLGGLGSLGCTPIAQVKPSVTVSQTVLSLQKLTCLECGMRIIQAMKKEKGVSEVRFEKQKAELFVSYQPKEITLQQIKQRVVDMGFVALEGPGKGAYVPSAQFKPDMDVRWISKQGESVRLEDHLVPGKVTVFDFSATWCGPCKDIDHVMFALLSKHRNLVLRKINIVDWDRPVVRQYMGQISQLPYVIIFDKQGKRHSEIIGRQVEKLQNTIAQLSK